MDNRIIKSVYESRFIPERYWNISFKNFEQYSLPEWDSLVKKLKNYGSHSLYKKGKGIFLSGDYRSGKTALSIALLKYILKCNKSAFYFIPVYTFYDLFFNDKDFYDFVKNQDFLVLDDFGREYKKKEFSGETLENFIRFRINANKGTMINSNLSLKNIKEAYGDAIYELLSDIDDDSTPLFEVLRTP